MAFFGVENLIYRIKWWMRDNKIGSNSMEDWKPKKLLLKPNPRYTRAPFWGQRPVSMISRIVVHQELGDGDTKAVHRYHISNDSHLKEGGAPKIAYHFTIEKNGTVYQVNELKDIVWHCRGQNMESVGIMLVGDFDGPSHEGTGTPTKQQLDSLDILLRYLIDLLNFRDRPMTFINGHCDFGKENCPGNEVMAFLKHRRKGLRV